MVRVAGKRKKTVFPVKRRGLTVDRLHLDRSKSDLAGDAEAAVEGVEKEELAQPMAALGLRDCQPRKKETRYGMLWQPFEQFRRRVGKFEMTRGQRVVAQDVRLSTNDGDVSRPQLRRAYWLANFFKKSSNAA